ncbi:aldehyde dehydrogenase family protein [Actinomycetospora endophytica]|uniref:Aldehyde dehydrogenase family protein n=1 Tax=Actinomycetospora endophytica TaxID=2291215 RepID=A0ABS8PEC4_9PSEU|nr:aldehyde dehydrogenase family protein [Actinomycetospora endophytica]MCD2196617.1 aldehyde dehydrogenase family protein [Actinomycetospora endophytica]
MSTTDRAGWRERAAAFAPTTTLRIDGREVSADASLPDHTPRDGSLLGDVPLAGPAEVDLAVGAARRAFDDGCWADAAPAHRKRVLLRFAELVREHTEELALAETLDTGKPIRESLQVDVPTCADVIAWYAEAIDKHYDLVAPTGPGALATITRRPLGVVAAVVPWNYPLIITSWKIGPALAAGNSVIVKPAEQSPSSALILARLGAEAGLPDGVLTVLSGDGPTTGAALGRHDGVDKVGFTGSVEVGRLFHRYSGESNGKAVAVEAGGKSAQLVLPDADLEAAASAIAWGIFYNAGQTCHAGSRVVVDRAVHDELVGRVVDLAKTFTVGDPLDPDTVLGAIVDRTQLDRVVGYLDLARSTGVRVASGGSVLEPVVGGTYVEPTVLDGVANSSRLAQEEIFGPVLSVIECDGAEEGVRLANATRFELAASVWTRDVSVAHRTAAALRAGTVWVNTFDAASVTTPFGGGGDTGGGRDRSLAALEAYSAPKTTWFAL